MKRGIKSFVLSSLSATISALLSPVTIKAAFKVVVILNTLHSLEKNNKTKPIENKSSMCCLNSLEDLDFSVFSGRHDILSK